MEGGGTHLLSHPLQQRWWSLGQQCCLFHLGTRQARTHNQHSRHQPHTSPYPSSCQGGAALDDLPTRAKCHCRHFSLVLPERAGEWSIGMHCIYVYIYIISISEAIFSPDLFALISKSYSKEVGCPSHPHFICPNLPQLG